MSADARLASVMSREVFISRPFLRYWRADAVSGLGTYVTLFALQALVILTLHGSAVDLGRLNAAMASVPGLRAHRGGDRRRSAPASAHGGHRSGAGRAAAGRPAAVGARPLSLPALILIVIAYGTASVVNVAAARSLMPRLVEARHLQPAHARIDGADAVASTAGPALGGLLVGAVGAPLAVVLDSLTYLYSALTLRRIDIDEPPPRTDVTARGLLRDVADGVRRAEAAAGRDGSRGDAEAAANEVLTEVTQPAPDRGRIHGALVTLRGFLAPVAVGLAAGAGDGAEEWARTAIQQLGVPF